MIDREDRKPLSILGVKNYCDGGTNYSLDVRFTAKCPAACSFCIAAEDMKNSRPMSVDAMVESTKKTDATTVSIVGGEPLLYLDKLHEYITRVKSEIPRIKEFYVTTALPYTLVTQRDKFDKVMNEITSLNVSIQHLDNTANTTILKTKSKFDRIGLLEDIVNNGEYGDKIRVHLNLVRGGIDNVQDLNYSLVKLREMGVTKLKLNELMNAPDEYISFEEITGVSLDSPYYHGCSNKIDYFPGIEITLKRSCFIVEESREASKLDLLKLQTRMEIIKDNADENQDVMRVLYEDGTLSNKWLNGAV